MTTAKNAVIEKIRSRQARIGVIGLGYVGLPLVLRFGEEGFSVIGFDVDPQKVIKLNRGESYIRHIASERVQALVGKKRFEVTSDFARLSEADCVIICVPTPLTAKKDPDMQYIETTAEAIRKTLRKGQVISLESTTYPGTTDEVLLEKFRPGGLEVGKDYFLVFSPEREDPGNPNFSTRTIPKVVGGTTPDCLEVGQTLYSQVIDRVVTVSSTRAAELVKLLENIYRSVNIALVNELKLVYAAMGIDVWEVIRAAKTKPFGFMAFYPGPGLGGHCIPIDPFYLTWKAREYGQNTRFIELAGEINTSMPLHVVNRTAEALNAQRKPLNGSCVLVLGLAYKPDVDDERESPSYVLMDLLADRGADVYYYDPYVPVVRPTREHPHWAGTRSVNWDAETLKSFDAVLIATNHQAVNYQELADWAQCIVDTRNAMANVKTKSGQVWKA